MSLLKDIVPIITKDDDDNNDDTNAKEKKCNWQKIALAFNEFTNDPNKMAFSMRRHCNLDVS